MTRSLPLLPLFFFVRVLPHRCLLLFILFAFCFNLSSSSSFFLSFFLSSLVKDLQEEYAKERDDLTQTTHELQRELKLRQMIIENFIPPAEAEKIHKRARFDDEGQVE